MVRASGYLKTLDDFRAIPLAARGGIPVRLGDVATVQVGPEMRRGIAELDGEGEVTGGIVDPALGQERAGDHRRREGALGRTAEEPAARAWRSSPPTTAARLIERAIHQPVAPSWSRSSSSWRSSARSSCGTCARRWWPSSRCRWACMTAFLVMRWQGINANIMSLGGIAIAIGAMVDAAVVMIENAHRKIEAWQHARPGRAARGRRALEGHHRCRRRGRAGAVLLAADHHAVVHPGVHAGGAGRAAVRAAGLHQDLRHGRGGRPLGDAGAGADGLLDPRPHSRRDEEPDHARR